MKNAINDSTLRVGDQVPHFRVAALDGRVVEYSAVWQRKFLLLVSLPDDPAAFSAFASEIAARDADWVAHETECVITRDRIPSVPCPGIVIADRWGEIEFVMPIDNEALLPQVDEILESVAYVRLQCPECQGETR